MAYVIHENQLKDILNDAMAENPWVPKADIIKWLRDNRDIKIMASDKYWDTQSVQDYFANKTDDEIDEIFWALEDEEWNPITTPEDTESSKPTKQERIDYAKKYDENEYSKIWDNAIKWFDESEPLMENAKKVTEAYEKLWDKKNELTSYYNSWRSWDSEVYQAKLDQINQALEAAETSDEFKSIVNTIRENWWASAEDFFLHPMIDATLEKMAMHYWSTMWWEKWESLKNTLYWDVANSWVAKIWWSLKWLHNLPNTYDEYNKWDSVSKTKNDKSNTNWDKNSTDWETPKWENPKWEQPKWKSSPFWPTKQTTPDIKTATDKMVFWEGVAAAWGNDYLENRNNQLATALKLKWIESREDIDAFLNQYDSWKNAKDEWKKNTLDKLTEKVGKIKTGKDKKDEKKSENKDDIFREDNLIKDKNGNTVWVKHIDIKKKEVWDDWTPSNDDSINGIEEDNIIRDKNWRMIWVKHLDIKKKKTAEESNEDIFNEDNLIKDKNGKTVWVKHIDIKKKKS